MIHSDKELEDLNELLLNLPIDSEGMTISEFDGFVAGIVVCPEMIPPSEWLSEVWGADGFEVFEDLDQADKTIQAVMAHYNRVARALASDPDSYEAIYGNDFSTGEMLWEPWISGFERAMALRPNAWQPIVESDDEEAAACVTLILAMNEINEGRSSLDEKAEDEIDVVGPDLIPDMVRTLNAWTKSQHLAHHPSRIFQEVSERRKVGRNEPCPCGSGRKYKRCCGAN